MARTLTSSQTIGPFFHPILDPSWSRMVKPETRGERIIVEGQVIDGDNKPLTTDGMLELWQANAEGRYNHPEDHQERLLDPTFHGFGRCGTDTEGRFRFYTIKPGAVAGPQNKLQAPHINVIVFSRGLLQHLYTRIYFPEEPLNRTDYYLNAAPAERRHTLIAKAAGTREGAAVYQFNIKLQGENETVFFDV
ncbi:MAG TPA: protocatechuate 3,4-dioxygenase subunit alpha [Candidatus Binataceae bacterium]|nr:protocatechuate 3,4-dioxygenase subunit alpha [Candidatus Binataceae bacterium]